MIYTSIFVLFVLFVLLVAFVLFSFRRKKGLTSHQKAQIQQHWLRAISQPDLHRRILDGDAVVAELLTMLGYQGSMADKLKRAESFIPDINAVWAAHKLRNRIAHEMGASINQNEADRAMHAFERVIHKFA